MIVMANISNMVYASVMLVLPFLLTLTQGTADPPMQPISRAVEADSCSYNPDDVIESPLRIGAWNTQRFGRRKMGNSTLANYFAQIIIRYDIIALQEVVDSSQEAVYELLRLVNQVAYRASDGYDSSNPEVPVPDIYNLTLSKRVGRTSYKEQYAVFYRVDTVSLCQSIQYADEADEFSYPPFIVVFNTPTISLDSITLVPIHASPSVAPEEIDSLLNVYDYITKELLQKDIVFLGDFNAGCTYLTSNDLEKLRLFEDERFSWLISDHVDTTTKYTTCPYDRIVVTGENLTEIIYERSAKAFHFDEELQITDMELVEDISDHFPVEVLLRGKVHTKIDTMVAISIGPLNVSVKSLNRYYRNCHKVLQFSSSFADILSGCFPDKIVDEKQSIADRLQKYYHLYGNEYINRTVDELSDTSCLGNNWNVTHSDVEESLSICGAKTIYTVEQGTIKQLGFTFKNMQAVWDFMEKMALTQSCIYTDEAYAIARHKVEGGVLSDPSIFMEDIPDEKSAHLYCYGGTCYFSVGNHVPIQ